MDTNINPDYIDEPQEPSPDMAGMVVTEEVVLKKYDGDYTEEQIESLGLEPIEWIRLVDGEIVEHWVK